MSDKQALPVVEAPTGNFLRPNGHGGYIIRQSDLSSWSRCQMAKFYDDRARRDPAAPQPKALSATVYGTVMHYALMRMEQAMHEGREDALDVALQTFEYYWQPENLPKIAERITVWLPRETYGGLRERGRRALKDQYDLLRKDESWLLALEYEFAVPVDVNGRLHTLTGTIDRLSIRRLNRKPYISLDDSKTGKQPTYLRYNIQGSAYGLASTLPEFWFGWPESGKGELEAFPEGTIGALAENFASWGYSLHSGTHRELPLASRRFRWMNLKENKLVDGGWRNSRDYARVLLAIDAYVRGAEAEVYAINTTGEVCFYCSHKHHCGGVGLPDVEAGAP